MKKLKADHIIEKFGGIRPLATRLGLPASTVQGWKKRGAIPEARIKLILKVANEAGIILEAPQSKKAVDVGVVEPIVNKTQATPKRSPVSKPVNRAPTSNKVEVVNTVNTDQPKSSGGDRREGDRRILSVSAGRRANSERRLGADPLYKGKENRKNKQRRSTVDRRSIERRRQQKIWLEKRRFIERSILTMVFLFILITIPAVFIMAPEWIDLKEKSTNIKDMNVRIERMDKRIKTLDDRHGSLSNRINSQITNIEKTAKTAMTRLDSIKKSAGSYVSEPMQQRITRLEKNVKGMSLDFTDMGSMMTQIQQLQNSPEGQMALLQTMQELQGMVGNLEGDVTGLNTAVNEAREENKTLATIMQDVSGKDVGAAAMLLALGKFRDSVGRDDKPFADDLAIMRKMVGDNPELLMAIDDLAPYAEDGVLSSTRLSEEFKGLAGDIVMAKVTGEELSVEDRARERLSSLVVIRKKGDVEGADTEAVVARAQVLLDKGDVKAALAELETLEGPAADAATPWIENAQGRVKADDISGILSEQILMQLTQGKQGSIKGLEDLLKQGFGNVGDIISNETRGITKGKGFKSGGPAYPSIR